MNDLSCWETKFKYCCYSKRLLTKLLLLNKTAKVKINILEIKKAIYYSRKYHGSQLRQSGEPYYSHPLQVAYMVVDWVFKTETLVVSILHDILEDTVMTREMINDIFGLTIANDVYDLTRIKMNKIISVAEIVKTLWLQEKLELLIIKQFDRLHNIQTIRAKTPDKIKSIVSETIEVFLILAAYLELGQVELKLKILCSQFFARVIPYQDLCRSLICGENLRLLAPIFQNVTSHNHNLNLVVKK